MIRSFILICIALTLGITASQADAAKIDSVYADSIYGGVKLGVLSAGNAFGKKDGQYATVTASGGSLFDLAFRRRNGITATPILVPIKANSTVVIWGRKDKDVDSSACQVNFWGFDGLGNAYSSDAFIFDDSLHVIQVPNTQYEYVEFSLPGVGVSPSFAKSFSIDAVALVEDTTDLSGVVASNLITHPLGLLANYPNPFVGTTNVSYELAEGGTAEISVVDAAGIEHQRLRLGYQTGGRHSARFDLGKRGMYFLRLYVGGIPIGNPVKVVSE